MTHDITGIAVALIALIFALAGAFLFPLIREKFKEEQFARFRELVSIGVYAAEQVFKGTGLGAKKKEYVIKFLAEHGVTMDVDTIEKAIEAEVFEMKKLLED